MAFAVNWKLPDQQWRFAPIKKFRPKMTKHLCKDKKNYTELGI